MEHPSLDRVQHLGDQPEEPEVGRAVFTERQRPDGAMALVVFDVLHLDGRSVMREPCATAGSGSRTWWRGGSSRAPLASTRAVPPAPSRYP